MTEPGSVAAVLETRGLGVKIGGQCVCEGLNLKVQSGQAWALLGPNGAGKSTLLHTLAGLRPAQTGQLRVRGLEIDSWSRRDLAQVLGVLFQHPDLGFPARVLEAVLSGRHPHLGRWGWESANDLNIARQALQQVGLSNLEARFLDSLSGGERRRVEIATLLTQQPHCALLDEPGNHLDPGQQIRLLELLRRTFTEENKALLAVVHDPTLALRYCDQALLLQGDGRWQAGAAAELLSAERLSRLYGYPVLRLEGPHGPVFSPA